LKLYNKTKLSDFVLEPLLVAAGRAVGTKTSGVVVKVTQGRNAGVSGMAHLASFVNTWHLKRISKWKSERVTTDGGWFRITIPWSRPGWDSLAVAQSLFEVAMHEWVHIRDYQTGGKWAMPFASRGQGGRRARHDSRPEELRAINAVDDAIAKGAVVRYQDVIIELAIEHENFKD